MKKHMINNSSNKNKKKNINDTNNDIYVTNLNRRFDAGIRDFLQICVLCNNSKRVILRHFLMNHTQRRRKLSFILLFLPYFFIYKRFSPQKFKFLWPTGTILYFIMPPSYFSKQWQIGRTIIIERSPPHLFSGVTGTDFACICNGIQGKYTVFVFVLFLANTIFYQ